ncbi:hypothetical protein NKH18_21165 [Streptomyces sp. M10(2022)]
MALTLSPQTAARFSLRAENGEHLGDIPSPRAVEVVADAVGTVGDYAEAMPEGFANGGQRLFIVACSARS